MIRNDLSLLLEVAYMIYDDYCERYRRGTVPPAEARWKVGLSCRSIAKYKMQCQEDLRPEDYPRFYFREDPVELPDFPDLPGTNIGNIAHSPLPPMWDVVSSDGCPDGGYQYSIFDYDGFINPV